MEADVLICFLLRCLST
ncbi:hypothetical protein D046_3019A, partial [Vibrio parahaemolyticus V-223/04]